jgi:hypothetical protein
LEENLWQRTLRKKSLPSAVCFRYTGASLGYQLASITAGGPAPIIATALFANYKHLASNLPSYALIVFYIIGMCVISFFVVLGLKEYAHKEVVRDRILAPELAVGGDD